MSKVTKPIVLNESYNAKMEALIAAVAGAGKGASPVVEIGESQGKVELGANVVNMLPALSGAIEISFAKAENGLDNEWVFVLTQGEEAQSVSLPDIQWYLGFAPAFEAGSVTEVRVHRVGDAFRGVWAG